MTSARVTSTAVPKTVVVLMKESGPLRWPGVEEPLRLLPGALRRRDSVLAAARVGAHLVEERRQVRICR